MSEKRFRQNSLFNSLPDEWHNDLLPEIQKQVKASRRKVVVLDDDPTGTQTVHDIPVLTEWSVESLKRELVNEFPAFYLLTNSRSFPITEAQVLNTEIGRNLVEAARQSETQFVVVSRSDSTLRGHFPGEVESLASAIGADFDGWLIIPFFLEGGRYTINDVHYVAEEEWLTPAGETEFARDAAFGYRSSNLRQWVEEKTEGRISTKNVATISIEEIRRNGPKHVVRRLADLSDGSVCIINAVSYRDMQVFTLGLLGAEARGKRFLYRTAASFVRVRAGIEPRSLLTPADLNLSGSGGLIVVGSHVPRSTSQLNELLARTDVKSIEVRAKALIDDRRRTGEIAHAAGVAESSTTPPPWARTDAHRKSSCHARLLDWPEPIASGIPPSRSSGMNRFLKFWDSSTMSRSTPSACQSMPGS